MKSGWRALVDHRRPPAIPQFNYFNPYLTKKGIYVVKKTIKIYELCGMRTSDGGKPALPAGRRATGPAEINPA
jgi:hypothetical protein